MRELELDGIHDDGEHLVLTDSDGERYTLGIDEALRAAVRRDRPALGMIRAAEAGALRPKDIQAMLRSGRTAEDISEMSQIPVDHVRRYEGPVLAERAWTAQRARTFHVGRGGPALEQMVTERLAARQADPDTAWDAWRRNDGTWALELTFSAAGRTRQAHWVVDLDNRTVTAKDDEARWISDEDADPEPSRGRTRLVAVKSSVYDLEADGSFDEGADRPRRRPSVSIDHPAAIDEADLDALNARRGLRSVPRADEEPEGDGVWSSLDDPEIDQDEEVDGPPSGDDDTVDGDDTVSADGAVTGDDDAGDDADSDDQTEDPDQAAWSEHSRERSGAEESTEAPSPSEDPAATGELEEDYEADAFGEGEQDIDRDGVGSENGTAEDSAGDSDDSDGRGALDYQDTVDLTPLPGFEQETQSSSETEPPRKQSPKKAGKSRSKRASMPSWDEIVFGSKHD